MLGMWLSGKVRAQPWVQSPPLVGCAFYTCITHRYLIDREGKWELMQNFLNLIKELGLS
jgi:hypothetical protein